MANPSLFTVKTKTSKKAYETGETIATTLRIPPELRVAWFHEVGKRMLSSKVGVGWKQTPSSQQIVVEDLANSLGILLPKETLKKPEHEESGVIRYMLNLPKSIHGKIQDIAIQNNESFNNVALRLLKSREFLRQQEQKELFNKGIAKIQISIPEELLTRANKLSKLEYKSVETFLANIIESKLIEKKPRMRF